MPKEPQNALHLNMFGPFSWSGGSDASSIYNIPESQLSGIYLWTVPTVFGELVYYIGETGRPFAQRFKEHFTESLSGMYSIYNPDEFRKGAKKLLWEGMWQKDEERRTPEFLSQYPILSKSILEIVSMFRFYLIPLSPDFRLRKRIEAAIANDLYGQGGVIGNFQDPDIRYQKRKEDEEPVFVKISYNSKILGLPKTLKV